MIIRGRMMQDCKMFIAYDILRSSIFFWYTYIHLTSNLLENISFVMLLTLAFI